MVVAITRVLLGSLSNSESTSLGLTILAGVRFCGLGLTSFRVASQVYGCGISISSVARPAVLVNAIRKILRT